MTSRTAQTVTTLTLCAFVVPLPHATVSGASGPLNLTALFANYRLRTVKCSLYQFRESSNSIPPKRLLNNDKPQSAEPVSGRESNKRLPDHEAGIPTSRRHSVKHFTAFFVSHKLQQLLPKARRWSWPWARIGTERTSNGTARVQWGLSFTLRTDLPPGSHWT